MAERSLHPDVETVHWGFLDANQRPVLEIDAGDIVTVHTVSGSASEAPANGRSVRPELRRIQEVLAPSPGPHILTGPILVRDAAPGDMLRIEVLDIGLRDEWGYNLTTPGKGVLPSDFAEPQLLHFAIDRETRVITTPWGQNIPARPFFGVIATAPLPEDGRLTSVVPGYFGGNMDNKQLAAGSTLYLPVSVEGGLLSVGDGHAAQGDGEVCLTAVETGLTGRLRVDVIKNISAVGPYAETPTHLITMAFNEDLDEAVRQALRSAIRMVLDRTNLTLQRAYALCSIAADVRITQLVNVKKGVHVMIPKFALGGEN